MKWIMTESGDATEFRKGDVAISCQGTDGCNKCDEMTE